VSYRVEFLSSAQREFLAMPKVERQRIGERIEALADNPRPPGCIKLSGLENIWRIRVGEYRVLYTIKDQTSIVVITRVAHRRESYR
jgi:mRNA interferase RelE/StbE